MTLLPIVERELRVAARKPATFSLRVAAALVALIIGGSVLLLTLTPFGGRTPMGGPIFGTLTWLCLAGALSAGLFFTSDCLSEEKREGTLGFLFLTDLRGYDVVLGKLLATSLRCVFALLAMFPVLAIALLLGGVEPGQFWRTLLALGHALFFSLAVGMFVSTISRQSQKALAGTLVLLLLLVGLGPGLDALFRLASGASRPMLSLVSPGYVFLTANYAPTFWSAFLVSQGVAWTLLALASGLLPRTWQEKPERTSLKVLSRRYARRYGGHGHRAGLRDKLLRKNPVMWLAARERGQAFWLWVVAVVMTSVFLALLTTGAPGGLWMAWSMVNTGLWYVLYLWAAAKGCQFFAEARRNGMIELMLAAPLTAQETVNGPWHAFVRMFAAPVLLLLGLQFVASLMAYRGSGSMVGGSGGMFGLGGASGWGLMLFAAVGGAVVAFANLVALGWFGLWMGLVSKTARMATLKTIVFVQVLPWFAMVLISGLAIPLVMFAGPWLNPGNAASQSAMSIWIPFAFTALPAGLALAKDVFFWELARRKLTRGFRELAVRAVIPVRAVAGPPVIARQP